MQRELEIADDEALCSAHFERGLRDRRLVTLARDRTRAFRPLKRAVRHRWAVGFSTSTWLAGAIDCLAKPGRTQTAKLGPPRRRQTHRARNTLLFFGKRRTSSAALNPVRPFSQSLVAVLGHHLTAARLVNEPLPVGSSASEQLTITAVLALIPGISAREATALGIRTLVWPELGISQTDPAFRIQVHKMTGAVGTRLLTASVCYPASNLR